MAASRWRRRTKYTEARSPFRRANDFFLNSITIGQRASYKKFISTKQLQSMCETQSQPTQRLDQIRLEVGHEPSTDQMDRVPLDVSCVIVLDHGKLLLDGEHPATETEAVSVVLNSCIVLRDRDAAADDGLVMQACAATLRNALADC